MEHPKVADLVQREWHAQGNRFAGGILLGGMLGGYDDTVRAVYYGETYLDPNKLQSNECRRLEVLSKAVFSSGHASEQPVGWFVCKLDRLKG